MKHAQAMSLLLLLCLISSCGTMNQPTGSSSFSTGNTPSSTTPIEVSSSPKDASSDYVDHQEEFSFTGDETGSFTKEDNVYTILAEGEYTAKGKLENGKILVNAPDAKVTIRLEGVSMTSTIDSLIYVEDADKVTIKAIDGTYNEILDQRALKDGTEEDEAGSAAIYAKTDLDVQGAGSLIVSSTYNNGIHAKKDLNIKKLTLKVTAIHNALKGNNSITIASGNLIVISQGGDGLKTSDSKVTSKGNQKGSINITGGNIDVYASCDAIDAAYDFNMSEDAENSPVVRLYTDKFSSYSTTVIESSSNKMYLRISGSYLDSTYRYAGCFYNSDEDYVWKNASYVGTDSSNPRRPYYIYAMDRPSSYINVQFYRFLSSQSENSFDTFDAKSEGGVINSNKDMFAITSTSNQLMEGTWTSYTTSSSGSSSGFSNKSDHSAKGVKAQNAISIAGGTMTITANDDGLHANSGEALDNGSLGVGDITITDGKLSISSTDDGIHAGHIGRFSNAQIEVTSSYEGIEANQLYFYSGTYYVTAIDDGINACNGSEDILVQVEGGYLDVIVGSGDTDAIDSNGDYKQLGGFVVARCGANDNSGNMAALDIDGTFYMEGGTFIGAGSMGTTPNRSKVNYVRFGSSSSRPGGGGGPGGRPAYGSSTTFTQGEYTISNTEISFTLNQSYSNLFICSDQLVLSTSYTLTNGTTTKTWTQSSSAVTEN